MNLKVADDQQAPLENATIELLRKPDSVRVKTALTDKAGSATLSNIPPGEYLARLSMINYETLYYPVSITTQDPNPAAISISMRKQVAALGAVTVTAKKPFIQKLSDRIVVNVASSIMSAGSSALEVLEQSPGVTVDQQDNISLRGRSGVTIFIDGKPTALNGTDLANYLRSLPSSSIERIDIITNPSARYDAAGNSGIIDIRMKKDQRLGTNGTFTAGYGQGIYPKANTGVSFNHRNKKLNFFGNYNYSYRELLNHLVLDRNFYNGGIYNGGDLKDNYSKMKFRNHTLRIGMDYQLSGKTMVGWVVNSNFMKFGRTNHNHSLVIDPQGQSASTFNSSATNDDDNKNLVANINFRHQFDSSGRELTFDADYGHYSSNALSHNATSYYKMDGSPLVPDYILDGDQDGELKFKTAKMDYAHPLGKKGKWEAGLKTSNVSSDNDAKFFDMSNGSPVNDENKTNRFKYNENNHAAYINYSREFGKFNIQAGLRAEQTNIKTEQWKGNARFDSSYLQLFPSAFFNYKIKEDQTLGLSVSRRIDRPGYGQLNPFLFLIDVTTYATGKPGLLPQMTWSYEMSYTHRSLSFTLGYSHTTHNQNIAIARFKDVFPNIPADDNVTVQIPINLESSDYFGLTVSAPVKISKWWSLMANGNIFYNHFNGNLGTTTLRNGKPAANMRVNNNFSFKKGWSAELNGSYNTSGQYGFMVSEPNWGIGAGVQKTVMKGKGTLRLNISDIFWTNLPGGLITYDNYVEKWNAYRESRVANLSFTCRFGNSKVQAARRRATASEEERRRAGN